MKLLEAVEMLSVDNINEKIIHAICDCIQDRLFWLELREPESDGLVYETWEEKYEELSDILEIAENVRDEYKNKSDNLEDSIDDLQSQIDEYQLLYGGLSRLKVNL